METVFVLLPLALLIAAIAVGFFVWAARSGQFDDLETPAVRILFDDEEPAFAVSASAREADAATAGQASGRQPTPGTPRSSTPTPPAARRVSE
jgi:cbb3-type cytochrome oxidase maturation protein